MNTQELAREPLHQPTGTRSGQPRPWYLVGMTGLASAGKASAAAALVARGYRAIAFADALRHQVTLAWGVSEGLLTAPATKHKAIEALSFGRCNDRFFRSWAFMQGLPAHAPQSPRAVMQAWGDFVRSADPMQYVRAVDRWIMEQLRRGHRHLVVTDVRLSAEWRLIKHRDGAIVRVYRPDLRSNDGHCTEQPHLLPFDASVINDGSLGRLHSQVVNAVCGVLTPSAAGVGA